jgi:hypothetical protein
MTVLKWILRALLVIGLLGLAFTLFAAVDLSSDSSKYRFPMEQGGACYVSLDAYRGCLWSRGWGYAALTAAAAVLILVLRKQHVGKQ